jgi:hypothetical protein
MVFAAWYFLREMVRGQAKIIEEAAIILFNASAKRVIQRVFNNNAE